ncbi:unnamed protein product, partial [Tilletia controversa]
MAEETATRRTAAKGSSLM